MPKRKLTKTRPHIGMLINNFEGRYQYPIWKGLADFGEKNDCDITFFTGRSLNSPNPFESQFNIIYELANSGSLDGLVLVTGTLSNFVNFPDYISYLKRFGTLPMVSLSIPVPGMKSILIDNQTGMKETVQHLIKVHGYRKIAFITGILSNPEARARLEVYKQVLEENGIAYEPSLVAEGDFSFISGERAIGELLDDRKVRFEAVVASNDEMAYSVYRQLRSRGIRMPHEIALTGFDDITEVQIISPPMTTVRQPLFEESWKAGKMLLDMIHGLPVPEEITLPTKLIVRESCGCLNIGVNEKTEAEKPVVIDTILSIDDLASMIMKEKEQILDKLCEPFHENPKAAMVPFQKDLSEILNAFIQSLKDTSSINQYYIMLNETLSRIDQSERYVYSESMDCWQKALTSLYQKCLLHNKVKEQQFLSGLFLKSQTLISLIVKRMEANSALLSQGFIWDIRTTNRQINSSYQIPEIMDILEKLLPDIGLPDFRICFYDQDPVLQGWDNWAMPETARLMAISNKIPGKNISENERRFPIPNLFNCPFMKTGLRRTNIIQSLLNLENHFGFIIFGLSNRDSMIYDAIRDQISTAVQIARLIEVRETFQKKLQRTLKQLEKYNEELHNLSLKDELTSLYNRRGLYVLGEQHFNLTQRNKGTFLIMFADLDGLKKINDTYGHKEGDIAIKTAGKVLEESFRMTDIVARMGGDEFTVIATDSNISQESEIRETITANLKKHNQKLNKPFLIEMSMGFSVFKPDKTLTFSDMLSIADKNLYEEKRRKKELK